MNDALYIAATGMNAQTSQLDAIAHNVSNVSTPGFKRSSVRFGDLISTAQPNAGADSASSTYAGVRVSGMQRSFVTGELRRVDDPMSIAIQGDGFLEVQLPDGGTAFVRSAKLEVNADRLLATADGLPLRPSIHIPADMTALTLGEDGQVSGRDASGRSSALGRIDLAVFANPSALAPLSDGVWQSTFRSGEAVATPAAEAGAGRIKQGYLEASNVQLVDEMVLLMVAQRAYEMSVKVMQAADEIAGMTNNLRK